MNVSESIKKLREEHGMTQEQFGKIAGVSSMAVSQWENGRAVPRMGSIQRLSDYFRIPKSKIMGDAAQYTVVEMPSEELIMSDERELLSLYRRMRAEQRLAFMEIARSLAVASEKESL